MSAIAMPVNPGTFGSASRPPRQHGSRLWLIAVAVWLAVVGLQIALSGSDLKACYGTTEALRQVLSYQA